MQKRTNKGNGHSLGLGKSVSVLYEEPKGLGMNQPRLEYLCEKLSKTIEEFPWIEKIVLSFFLYEEPAMPEVANMLGITHQRIHQIYSRVIWNLKSRIHDLNAENAAVPIKSTYHLL